MLVEKITPKKKMRYIFQQPRIIDFRVGCAGRFQRDHGTHPIRVQNGGSQSEITALAMRQDNGAAFDPVQQRAIGVLRSRIIAAPARHALRKKGIEMIGGKALPLVSSSLYRIGVP